MFARVRVRRMGSVWLAVFVAAAAAGGDGEERPRAWAGNYAALDAWANWVVLGNGFDDAEWYEEEEENATAPTGGYGAWSSGGWAGAGDDDDGALDRRDDDSTSLNDAA